MNEVIKNGTIILLIILNGILVIGFFINREYKLEYSKKLNEYKERQKYRDSIIFSQDNAIRSLRQERDSLVIQKDTLILQLDASFTRIEKLSKPAVTQADKKDALKWIEEHNLSLTQ